MRIYCKKPEKPYQVLSEWVHRLGLVDWAITLHPDVPEADMSLDNATGDVDYNETSKTARIDILRECDFGDRVAPFNWEKTLIHELLHLKLCLVADVSEPLQARYMHQIIDDLARALYEAKISGTGGFEFKSGEECEEVQNENN